MEEQSREAELQPPVLDGELHLLLGDLKDEASGYRRREATWISIVVHGAIVLALVFMPKWLPQAALIVPVHQKDSAVFLDPHMPATPPVKPPKTNIVSDQDRVAQSKTPTIDKETLRHLADARRPGPPKPVTPAQQPAGESQAMPAPQAPPQASQPAPPPPPQTTETAKLEAPVPKQNPFAISSAGSAVDRAIHAAANDHPGTHETFGGDRGSGIRPKNDHRGSMDILSDTMGVDFGPYMKRLHVTVEDHWFPLIPEVALPPMMKKGVVVIEFAIMQDGTIKGAQVVVSSGDSALDRAAYGALLNASPVPRLPREYTAGFLKIRAAFYYNPDKNDFQ
jgi:TonB family protein